MLTARRCRRQKEGERSGPVVPAPLPSFRPGGDRPGCGGWTNPVTTAARVRRGGSRRRRSSSRASSLSPADHHVRSITSELGRQPGSGATSGTIGAVTIAAVPVVNVNRITEMIAPRPVEAPARSARDPAGLRARPRVPSDHPGRSVPGSRGRGRIGARDGPAGKISPARPELRGPMAPIGPQAGALAPAIGRSNPSRWLALAPPM